MIVIQTTEAVCATHQDGVREEVHKHCAKASAVHCSIGEQRTGNSYYHVVIHKLRSVSLALALEEGGREEGRGGEGRERGEEREKEGREGIHIAIA